MANEKFTLTLNSHSLSSFQECESKHLYSHLLGVEGLNTKLAMDRGTLYARFLETYYKGKISPKLSRLRYIGNAPLWIARISKRLGISSQDSQHLYGAMLDYLKEYQGESWIPLATERGFSKIIYEDAENLFVYEGRPDLVALSDPINKDLLVIDHKTQGKTDSFYAHNNQAYGYMWNYTNCHQFVYNYIVFTKVTQFRREAFEYHASQIEAWCNDTIEWFFRVKNAIQKKSFLKSMNCQGRWGCCPYTLICERPTEAQKLSVIRMQYKKRKPYRSW